MTPQAAGLGDLAVIFFSGRVLLVLRRLRSCYTLLGECYIHGIMDGEVIDAWEEGRLEEEIFTSL